MTAQHPENLDRPTGSYDPDELLVVRYGDVMAARNAVGAWIQALKHRGTRDVSAYQQSALRSAIALSVERESLVFDTNDELLAWLRELQARLTHALPD